MPQAAAPEFLEEDLREFLIESYENLGVLDRELVELEQRPADVKLIGSVFRTVHSIKGTSGFFGLEQLGAVAHSAENLLCQVREGQRPLTPVLISLVLQAVDRIKVLLARIESTGQEGARDAAELLQRLADAELADPEEAIEQKPASGSVSAGTAANDETQAEAAQADGHHVADQTIRVDVRLLDQLVNLTGELVLARNQLLRYTGARRGDAQDAGLKRLSQRFNLLTTELQEGVMKTRMQPIGAIWNKLPRVVRDLAGMCGKRVRIEMEGAATELDKTIIEAIKDPLTHIVRNSCDHGIESPEDRREQGKPAEGLLRLRAFHQGGVVHIEVSDDGAGIDPEKLKRKALERGLITVEVAAAMGERELRQLIFLPGFSTAAQVTSISGRGVGMDVVKTNIERIGGSVEVLAGAVCGTITCIRIPLTLAIVPGLVVSIGHGSREQRMVIPQANLLELVRLEGAQELGAIKQVHGAMVFHHRGRLLPLLTLAGLLQRSLASPGVSEVAEVVNLVLMEADGCRIALAVDGILDTEEIVVKPLSPQLSCLEIYAGATIMGDGRPALILDAGGLARLAGLGKAAVDDAADLVVQEKSATEKMLLFSAGSYPRLAVSMSAVARLEHLPCSRIEQAGGHLSLQYRDEILPLIVLEQVLEGSATPRALTGDTVLVIVFAEAGERVGVAVDSILDIVDERAGPMRASAVDGLRGATVIAGRVTALLDLEAVMRKAGEHWAPAAAAVLPFATPPYDLLGVPA